ncbi:membrane-bound lytic murein transglycosylase MltF [Burkholderiaceae bacterium DAT-1]|nr:membrane-bound lytic murein transglycosylase MltF [Burkholderiaceae bacterium DAT-1]
MLNWCKRIACLAASMLVLAGCDRVTQAPAKPAEKRLAMPSKDQDLVVLIRNGATSFFVDAESKYAGPEYDLVRQFAEAQGWHIKLVVTPNQAEMVQRLARGEAHMAVGMTRRGDAGMHVSQEYARMQPVVVVRDDAEAPARLTDLEDKIWVSPAVEPAMSTLQAKAPKARFIVDNDYDDEALIERVASGLIDYAVVDQRAADAAQNFYPDVAIAFMVGQPLNAAWMWADASDTTLGPLVDAHLSKIRKSGALSKLFDRYYGYSLRLETADASEFLTQRITTLPKLKKYFVEAEASYGIDWRLLAALAYQESHWDKHATSPYGVRGIMMLTNDTANRMGVHDRLDPRQSILGGAKYLSMLKSSLSDKIVEPDRTWFTLAAYNIGTAHLEDARVLAQKQKKNPSLWEDVKQVLPLLREPEHYENLKFGFARGGEAVVFVENLRSYYDILVRFEAPVKPIFPPFDDKVTVANPAGLKLGIDASGRKPQPASATPQK